MIKFSRLVPLLGVVFFLAGCAPQNSLFPLFTNDDKAFEKRLLGEWKINAGDDGHQDPGVNLALVVFSPRENETSYDVRIPKFNDTGGTMRSTARLVRLGTYLFIDLGSPNMDIFRDIPYPASEAHCFGRLILSGDTVRIDFLNDDWVTKQVEAGKLGLSYVKSLDGALLSADTPELRKFALEHAEDHEAFSNSYVLTRNK
ncbi:MAG: hypothetical protein ACHQLQ_16505 [Candidatus Acidiferrales bacterium]